MMQHLFQKHLCRSLLAGLLMLLGNSSFTQNNHSGENEKYQNLIDEANEMLTDKQHKQAIVLYQEALSIKTGDKYASRMIDSINGIIDNKRAFEKVMKQAATYQQQKNYKKAKDLYEKAIKLNPDAEFPKYKLEMIREVYTDPEELAAYKEAINQADMYFDKGEFDNAILHYEKASSIMPDKEYAVQMIIKSKIRLKEYKKIKAQYDSLIDRADVFFKNNTLENAKSIYQQALDLRIENSYPEKRIYTIDSISTAQQERENNYDKAIHKADSLYIDTRFAEAKTAYKQALEIKSDERYPRNMLSRIDDKILEMKDRTRKYEEAVAKADELYAANNLEDALIMYKKAGNLKPTVQYQTASGLLPGKSYPEEQVAAIDSIFKARKEMQANFEEALSAADRYYEAENYMDARNEYEKALEYKPSHQHAQQRFNEVNAVIKERQKAIQSAYDKSIANADGYYQMRVYDKAIEAFREAENIKPDESYPKTMINRIKEYLNSHSVLELVKESMVIKGATEKKLNFESLPPNMRNNNFIRIKMRKSSDNNPKLFINYGEDNRKNGGLVLKNIHNTQTNDYIINLSEQDPWYRMNNNWISIYPEGGDVEISLIQISTSE